MEIVLEAIHGKNSASYDAVETGNTAVDPGFDYTAVSTGTQPAFGDAGCTLGDHHSSLVRSFYLT